MGIRNWIRFFTHTLLIGGAVTGILGFIIRWNEFSPLFANGEWKEVLSVLTWLIGVGFTFSVISQMGFFAYLTIHQFGLGLFRSYWTFIQLALIVVVLFDLVYFRFKAFSNGEDLGSYLMLAAILLVFGFLTAYIKAKGKSKNIFIAALFFMVVVTTLEWLPVLQANEKSWLYLMLFTLLPCNAFQLLMLPKYNQKTSKAG
ncbi:KinB-signaling pathway activation protein [Domibacillus sp. A3M-37]|uniref:KinB-signaling pathway activation protein n=1 Tax=Domibacillus TaxID=1433999 RepID=UPI0020B8291C|nr:KinB-signaling pathway activation protein [Domibacillus sp. A3M-37]MCP3764478.1 KinB-signaling pathway activation protein [Domibacillus sp. A3M-37]